MIALCLGIILGMLLATILLYIICELDEQGKEFECLVVYSIIFIVIFICILVILERSLGWNI